MWRRVTAWLALALVSAKVFALEATVQRDGLMAFDVIRVDPRRDRLELFLNDPKGRPFHGFAPLAESLRKQGRTLRFAMNAGMYEPDYAPVGLFVSEGRQAAPLNLRNASGNFYLKPNGVFWLDAKGAHVTETRTFARMQPQATLATQSGPMLVIDGTIHPAFLPASPSRLIRNGVGVTRKGEVVFVISETPVNFHEFASYFRDVLQCDDALYLDGSVSSIYAPALGRADAHHNLGPIIGVTGARE